MIGVTRSPFSPYHLLPITFVSELLHHLAGILRALRAGLSGEETPADGQLAAAGAAAAGEPAQILFPGSGRQALPREKGRPRDRAASRGSCGGVGLTLMKKRASRAQEQKSRQEQEAVEQDENDGQARRA